MMQSFFRARTAVLALSATMLILSLAGCPGHLEYTPWLPDAGYITPPSPMLPDAAPPPPPPPPMADAAPPPPPPPKLDAAPPPPPMTADAGSRPDAPVASETWCKDSTEVIARILQPRCGACHSASTMAGTLDLTSPGVAARLIDVPVAAAACRNQVLVTMTPQVGGHFFTKLERSVENCGDRMPAAGLPSLSIAEVQCLKDWLSATGAR
jgi:hypothetical protein